MARVLLIQGPNMSYLGKRQPELYGTTSAAELDALLIEEAKELGCTLDIFYTHVEGEAIARIPTTLSDALDALAEDEVIKSALPGDLHGIYDWYKRDEWNRFIWQVSDWDVKTYLDCLP